MTPSAYTEDTLVQQTTAEYLEQEPGEDSVIRKIRLTAVDSNSAHIEMGST